MSVTNIDGRYTVPSAAVNVRPTVRCSIGIRGRSGASCRRRVDLRPAHAALVLVVAACHVAALLVLAALLLVTVRLGVGPGVFGEVPAFGALVHPQPAGLAGARGADPLTGRPARDRHRRHIAGHRVGDLTQHRADTHPLMHRERLHQVHGHVRSRAHTYPASPDPCTAEPRERRAVRGERGRRTRPPVPAAKLVTVSGDGSSCGPTAASGGGNEEASGDCGDGRDAAVGVSSRTGAGYRVATARTSGSGQWSARTRSAVPSSSTSHPHPGAAGLIRCAGARPAVPSPRTMRVSSAERSRSAMVWVNSPRMPTVSLRGSCTHATTTTPNARPWVRTSASSRDPSRLTSGSA